MIAISADLDKLSTLLMVVPVQRQHSHEHGETFETGPPNNFIVVSLVLPTLPLSARQVFQPIKTERVGAIR
jgi:hypothetical protein